MQPSSLMAPAPEARLDSKFWMVLGRDCASIAIEDPMPRADSLPLRRSGPEPDFANLGGSVDEVRYSLKTLHNAVKRGLFVEKTIIDLSIKLRYEWPVGRSHPELGIHNDRKHFLRQAQDRLLLHLWQITTTEPKDSMLTRQARSAEGVLACPICCYISEWGTGGGTPGGTTNNPHSDAPLFLHKFRLARDHRFYGNTRRDLREETSSVLPLCFYVIASAKRI